MLRLPSKHRRPGDGVPSADGRIIDRRPLRSMGKASGYPHRPRACRMYGARMRPLARFARYVKSEMWRPEDSRIHVRKRRPGLGWTINVAAVRARLRRR
jgi:hypothetical protein